MLTYGSGFGLHLRDTSLSFHEHLTQTEVDNLDIRIFILVFIKEVLRLQISMDDALGVAVVHTLHDLLESVSSLNFSEEFLLDNLVEQLTTGAELSNEIEVFLVFEVLVELEDVRVI